MKTIDIQQAVATAVPVMSRKERLLHWAALVRRYDHRLTIFHHLEHQSKEWLANACPSNWHSAFSLAENDS
jgi:hypothetical protein